jgi:hypothetical protein
MLEVTKVKRVFISHGHNEVAKHKLKDFVRERLRMEPVILAEQPDLGLTVVEKLEKYGPECQFALVLFTADDQTVSGESRARQNVTHELGFFHGLLGRDRVLLLKQAGVELFSNISGLIYKEFERDGIESVFEDIRIALESCSAEKGGLTIPKKEPEDISQHISKAMDIIAHDWPRMERDRTKQGMQEIIGGLAVDLHSRRIKRYLEDERREYETRLEQTQAEAETRKEAFGADPEHGGKMAAMTLSIFESIAPRSAIRLIDKLLGEISFLETEGVSPKDILSKLIGMCDMDGD